MKTDAKIIATSRKPVNKALGKPFLYQLPEGGLSAKTRFTVVDLRHYAILISQTVGICMID
jgi:hypothetical protein